MSETSPWVFGEVLFDCFPDGSRVLGGAPFNVAWHLQALGQQPRFISRVGRDEHGREIQQAMRRWQMDRSGLQVDGSLPTGRVTVSLNRGEPDYEIDHPAAWDRIRSGSDPEYSGLLYHGTLALRDAVSRETLQHMLGTAEALVFVDVNLRQPWWELDAVLQCVRRANWVKLNEVELDLIAPGMSAQTFLENHQLDGLILTRGEQGAECLERGREPIFIQPGSNVPVIDTVGAGDAMTAVIICGLLQGWPMNEALERAQVFASAICGRRGAIVEDEAFYRRFIDQWSLE